MYICPTCGKELDSEIAVQKHFLICWKEQHPYHKSKSAPRGKDIEVRQVNEDIANFFKSLGDN